MTETTAPPIGDDVINEENKFNLSWILFMNSLFQGDTGTAWTPTFQNLATTGTPTITGRYYRLTKRLVYFSVLITPATDSTATAGTTYIDNFPLTPTGDGICFAVSGALGSNSGHIVASSNRIYVPGWPAVTVPLTIIGLCEVAYTV